MNIRGVALNLQGPMQSWGGSVVGDDRPTYTFPTKSGVLGLVASCLGIQRSDIRSLTRLANSKVHIGAEEYLLPGSNSELSTSKLGHTIRVSHMVDYQTIQNHPLASKTRQGIVSKRSYLCDASFIAIVIPSDSADVEDISNATRKPKFSPYLGRRCCVLTAPLHLGIVEGEDPIELILNASNIKPKLLDTSPIENFYIDEADYPGSIRKFPVRDVFCGPLQRQYTERIVSHVYKPIKRV